MRRKHKHLIYTGNTVKGDLYMDYHPFCHICKGLCRNKDSAEYIDTGVHIGVYEWKCKPRHYCKHNPVLNRTVYTAAKNARRSNRDDYYYNKDISEARIENRRHIKEAIMLSSDMKEFKLWHKSKFV